MADETKNEEKPKKRVTLDYGDTAAISDAKKGIQLVEKDLEILRIRMEQAKTTFRDRVKLVIEKYGIPDGDFLLANDNTYIEYDSPEAEAEEKPSLQAVKPSTPSKKSPKKSSRRRR